MGIPKYSVKKPVTIIMIFSAVALLGLISLSKLKVELYQNSGKGIISIITHVRGGMPPSQVEDMVTRPIEEVVSQVSNVKGVYSTSKEAESRVTLHFETGTDMNYAALEVREKFAKVKDKLPKEIQKPVIAKYDESQSPIYVVSFTSDIYTPEQTRIIIEEELKSRIMRLQGVAKVDIYGGRERKILVEIDKQKLDAYQITFERVMQVLGANNFNILTGGITRGGKEFHIRAIGEFLDVSDIGNIGVAITSQGSIIQLKQIARVVDSFLEPQDFARLNLEQNVSMYIKKESLANTITVTDLIQGVVDDFQKEFKKKGIESTTISNAGVFINKAVHEVASSLLFGGVLAMLIIFVFLNDFQATFIIGLSMPLSVLATFIVMNFCGISINIMTLSGLTLAIGIMVDSSIVVLENIHQKLQNKRMSFKRAVVAGSEEMWVAIFASTITTIVVFLPIIFIDKEIKIIYQGLAFTVTASLFASLFIALSIVPTLSSILPRKKTSKKRFEIIPMTYIRKKYRNLLIWSFRNRSNVMLTVGVIFLLAMFGLVKRDFDIPSHMSENEFAVIVIPPPGANLEANDTVMKGIEKMLEEYKEVKTISTTVRKDDPRLYVTLYKKDELALSRKEITTDLKEKANKFAKKVHQDYSVIIDEGISVDASKQLVINIFGIETEVLEKLANQVAKALGQVSGIGNILMTDLRRRPEYNLVIDKGRAALHGLSVDEIAQTIHGQMRGMRPTKYHSEGQEIETITRLEEEDRKTLEDLKSLVITSQKNGERVYLEQVASFEPSFGPTSIDKMNKFRYVFVKAKIFEGALEAKAREVDKLLKEIEMPKDYFYKFGGQYPQLKKGKRQLSIAILITIMLIFMILASLFQSYYQPFIILFSIPLSCIGVWISLKIADKPLSQPVLLGMIMLSGIVVNNAIILIDHANLLREKGYSKLRAIITSGQDRLQPILMTTASTVFGFAPLAFGWSESSDLWAPLAITVVGGLTSSTLFTIFIVPNIYAFFEDFMDFSHKKLSKAKIVKPRTEGAKKRHASWG